MYFTQKERDEMEKNRQKREWKERPITTLFWSLVAAGMIVLFIIYGPWVP